MKNSLFVILFIVIVAGFIGCKKKPVEYPAPKFQYFSNGVVTHIGSYRLFAKAGEITNTALVQQYQREFAQFFYSQGSKILYKEFTRFAVVNDDSLINLSIVPVAEVKRKLIDDFDKFGNKGSVPVNDTNALNLHFGKYKIYQLITTPSGYAYFDVESPVYFLKRVKDTLFFPMVKYIDVSRGPNIVSFGEDRFNNAFSPAGFSNLGNLDTLLVQTFELAMPKEL